MARKRTFPASHAPKRAPKARKQEEFKTMFFDAVADSSVAESPASRSDNRAHHSPAPRRPSLERHIWMWAGVGAVMLAICVLWAQSISTRGILNIGGWMKQDQLISESRKTLSYYFDKQNTDMAQLNALSNKEFSAQAPAPSGAINAQELQQLKEKIQTTAAATSSLPVAPSKLP